MAKKNASEGKSTSTRKARNRAKNEAAHQEKVDNAGLGRRDIRRINAQLLKNRKGNRPVPVERYPDKPRP